MDLEEFSKSIQGTKSWKGTSLPALCKNRGPWSFSITPVYVSKYHSVLYELPVHLQDAPKPHISSDPHYWDENHVRMPFSEKNLFPIVQVNFLFFLKDHNFIKDHNFLFLL